jgi:hypothetical protein
VLKGQIAISLDGAETDLTAESRPGIYLVTTETPHGQRFWRRSRRARPPAGLELPMPR